MSLIVALAFGGSATAETQAVALSIPAAIFTDPPFDAAHPPRAEVLHIPSGGVEIVGVAYLAGGSGAHPTVVLLHGLPGTEKNLDLAQAIRRAGWNCITFNYRGSWGSPGDYSFLGDLADSKAVLAFVRDPTNAAKFGIDVKKLVLMGHSMGGWVTALTAAQDTGLAGAVLISPADIAGKGAVPAAKSIVAKSMAENMESLAGTSPDKMADEIISFSPRLAFNGEVARGLSAKPVLVLTADDGLAPSADKLVKLIQADGGPVTLHHEATDHSWSGERIALEALVITWLQGLR